MTTEGRYSPRAVKGDASDDGPTLVTIDGVPQWLPMSRPVIPLPAGSDSSDVPAGTPVGTIIFVKA